MIQQVEIKNFKCLRDVTVNLEPFTLLVGTNGSGKTSFLQALDLLCRTFRMQGMSPSFPGLPGQVDQEFLAHRSSGRTDPVEISCQSDGARFRFRTPTSETGYPSNKWAGDRAAFLNPSQPETWQPWETQKGLLPNPLWLQLDPNQLRNPGVVNHADRRMMAPNGAGLHSATASMNLEDPDLWQKLQADLRTIVPSVRRLRHTPENVLLFDTVNGTGLKANQISEGTLLTLGLLTAIHGSNQPGILLLDDMDRGLHPKAQRDLIELLRGVQETNPEIQIVGSTHSPYMLDCMKPNEVLVTSLREDGSTACDSLTHHPSFNKWKDEFDAGEMWSFFGDTWVAEKEAAIR